MINRINKKKINVMFDLIVIGGGINGCGIARDAAQRGLKVLLLEKEDYGSGCTSASTRLIHGGFRYLEHLEFSLVRESLVEREYLLNNASHLVKPLEFCFPVYKFDKRKLWFISIGMMLYELLAFGKSLPKYKILSPNVAHKFEPSLNNNNLSGLVVYYDAQVEFPERLCLENILMAANKGAITLNHAKVTDIKVIDGKIDSVTFADTLTESSYAVQAQCYINASGPWVDELCGLTKQKIKRQIGGTKGSHIIVREFPSAPKHPLLLTARSDNRPIFLIPWNKNYLIGTTDLHFSGDLDHIKVDYDEVQYLLSEVNHVLKDYSLTKDDILFTYSGVRPLPYVGDKNPATITRKHIIHDHSICGIENMLSVIGGKLTTYRNLSQDVVDLVFKKINHSFVSCTTLASPLHGSPGEEFAKYKAANLKRAMKKYDLEEDIVEHIISLYGKKYKNVLDISLKDNQMGRLLSSHSLDIQAQIYYALEHEQAYTISDLFRRIPLGLSEGNGEDALPVIAQVLSEYYQLSESEINSQIEVYSKRTNNTKPKK